MGLPTRAGASMEAGMQKSALVCLAMTTLVGCCRVGVQVRAPVEAPPPAVAPLPEVVDLETLRGRFQAAKKISALFERDDAMKGLARDIARRGHAGDREQLVCLLKQVLASINALFERDDVTKACAISLARRGMTSEATALAEQINALFERDALLKRIASGKY